jgi:hypothetical protein
MVIWTDGFLKRDKPRANEVGAPNGEVPSCRCTKIVVGTRRSDGASPFVLFKRYPPA